MTALIITPEAFTWIQEATSRNKLQRPLTAVVWNKGNADLRRGTEGEAIWDRESAGWLVTVLDLSDLKEVGVPWSNPMIELQGYQFTLCGKPESPQLEGCTLTVKDGRLVVIDAPI